MNVIVHHRVFLVGLAWLRDLGAQLVALNLIFALHVGILFFGLFFLLLGLQKSYLVESLLEIDLSLVNIGIHVALASLRVDAARLHEEGRFIVRRALLRTSRVGVRRECSDMPHFGRSNPLHARDWGL